MILTRSNFSGSICVSPVSQEQMKRGLSDIRSKGESMLVNVFMDGDQWCAMEADSSLAESVAGFGNTMSEALIDFANQLGS